MEVSTDTLWRWQRAERKIMRDKREALIDGTIIFGVNFVFMLLHYLFNEYVIESELPTLYYLLLWTISLTYNSEKDWNKFTNGL